MKNEFFIYFISFLLTHKTQRRDKIKLRLIKQRVFIASIIILKLLVKRYRRDGQIIIDQQQTRIRNQSKNQSQQTRNQSKNQNQTNRK